MQLQGYKTTYLEPFLQSSLLLGLWWVHAATGMGCTERACDALSHCWLAQHRWQAGRQDPLERSYHHSPFSSFIFDVEPHFCVPAGQLNPGGKSRSCAKYDLWNRLVNRANYYGGGKLMAFLQTRLLLLLLLCTRR